MSVRGYREPDVPRRLTAWDRLADVYGMRGMRVEYVEPPVPGDGPVPGLPRPARMTPLRVVWGMLRWVCSRVTCVVLGHDMAFGEYSCLRCAAEKRPGEWR